MRIFRIECAAISGVIAVAAMIGGCHASRLAQQGIDFRQGLLNIYTEQILDNLIRAYNDVPFMQMEITEIFAQEFDEIGVTGSFGETVTDARTLLLSGASSNQAQRMILTPWMLMGNKKRQGTLNFKAKPVTNRDAIYDAYITFAKNEKTFQACKKRPDKSAYHAGTLRRRNGIYYYVPVGSRDAYRGLFLRTTFQLEAHGTTGFYAVRIQQVKELETTDKGSVRQVIVFDNKIPAGEAILVVDKDGKTARIPLFMFQPGVGYGDKTDRLEAEYNPAKRGVNLANYIGMNARVYSREFPPEPDSLQVIEEGLERAVNSLDRINATQR